MSMRIKREEVITVRRGAGQSRLNLKVTQWGAIVTKARPNGPIGRPLANALLMSKAITLDEYRATEEMYKRWYPEKYEGDWNPEVKVVPAWL